ncbi:hypothetical protein [Engelhardtia mirabilis]|uniref:Glycosyltransferase RgtA/B/C/D-like domain-containing protein n=1 Tax=Engelhardtia mirabilis TaxID=2528011 RepID=A0A518BJ35_9BACT|nr:hypothetical protein Pla133_20540 [Planctomycetes bacterium Pla133]QDV01305.1 hypothetical protein Pla86_20540 [Planctomycetes bacterium Pla86]
MVAAAALLAALGLAGPIRSGDLWWHLRTGDWILAHGALPATDPFSHTAGDEPWVLQEYGSQVLFALLHGATGLGGLRVVGALLAILLVVYAYRCARAELSSAWAAAATCIFAALFALKWELRPHLLSAFFVLRLHRALFAPGAAPTPSWRTVAEVGLLACVWVQLHAEALFAPIMALAGLMGACLSGLGRASVAHRPTHLVRWAAVFTSALAGTLVSPLGLTPHTYALFRRSVPKQYIEEWFPSWILPGDPRFEPLTVPLFVLVAACLLATGALGLAWGLARLTGRRAPRWEQLGFLGACGFLALDARRFFWLLWFPLREFAARWTAGRQRAPWLARATAAGALAVLAPTHYVGGAAGDLAEDHFAQSVDPRLFPVFAADVVREAGLTGNLFHPYEWGGYLGWILGDANPTFIDGRTVLFEKIIPERWRAERDPDFAREVLRARDVRVIVFKRFVVRDGQARPWRPPDADVEWIRAWADDTAEVWLRADQAESLASLERWHAAQGLPFDAREGFVEVALLAADPDVREPRFFPAEVRAALDPFLRAVHASDGSDPAAWDALAEACAKFRLGRSVRHCQARAAQLRGSE